MTTTVRDTRSSARSAGPSEPRIPAEARPVLLDIARDALRVATGIASPLALTAAVRRRLPVELRLSVFVTLTEAGNLRGCMGTLRPDQPLEETVALTAITAALHDPRFVPLAADELPMIHVDVSVLGEPRELRDPADFVPGVHGIIVERGGRGALLLPEVASDQGWDGEGMLGAVCDKAGLPRDAWRDARTRRRVFRTVRFGGPAMGAGSVTG